MWQCDTCVVTGGPSVTMWHNWHMCVKIPVWKCPNVGCCSCWTACSLPPARPRNVMNSERVNVKGRSGFVSYLADFVSLCLYEDQATVTPEQWTCATCMKTVMEEMTSIMTFVVSQREIYCTSFHLKPSQVYWLYFAIFTIMVIMIVYFGEKYPMFVIESYILPIVCLCVRWDWQDWKSVSVRLL